MRTTKPLVSVRSISVRFCQSADARLSLMSVANRIVLEPSSCKVSVSALCDPSPPSAMIFTPSGRTQLPKSMFGSNPMVPTDLTSQFLKPTAPVAGKPEFWIWRRSARRARCNRKGIFIKAPPVDAKAVAGGGISNRAIIAIELGDKRNCFVCPFRAVAHNYRNGIRSRPALLSCRHYRDRSRRPHVQPH